MSSNASRIAGARIALALGGGGARGYAHIGVIRELQARGCEIIAVAGTSMGAVIGGLHAASRLDAYVDWVSGLSQRDVLRLMDPSIKAPGVIRAEKVMGRVATLLDGARIELVLTDLKPNRPTMEQIAKRPGLDPIRSRSIGGAAIEGTVILADGSTHEVSYDWFSSNLADVRGHGTWTDADRAYSRLARNLATGRYEVR